MNDSFVGMANPRVSATLSDDLQVARPELFASLLVSIRHVSGRVHSDRQRVSPEALEGLGGRAGRKARSAPGSQHFAAQTVDGVKIYDLTAPTS